MKSQTRHFSFEKGNKVIPSGRLPSSLHNPGGSRTEGYPASDRAVRIILLISEWRGIRPTLILQERGCRPKQSTLLPQRQECSAQTGCPILRASPTRRQSCSRWVPTELLGGHSARRPSKVCFLPEDVFVSVGHSFQKGGIDRFACDLIPARLFM